MKGGEDSQKDRTSQRDQKGSVRELNIATAKRFNFLDSLEMISKLMPVAPDHFAQCHRT